MSNKAINKDYLLRQLKNFDDDVLSETYSTIPIEITQARYNALTQEEKMNGTIYLITDASGGGGTTVVANPSGTATDDLEKLQVGTTIYKIPDTTYESKQAAQGGTDVSLVTTGEKYTWNEKVSKSATAGLLKNDGTVDQTQYVSDISGKSDKVNNATNGNFAGLDSNGNLTDSGKKASDFLPSNTPIPDEVTANPQGTATGTLTKLGIGSDIYEIQDSRKRKYLFIGDSYGSTYTAEGVTITGWLDKIGNIMGLTSQQYENSWAISGQGFRGGDYAWKTTMLTKPDDNDVTDVVFVGGDNDIRYGDDPTLITAINETITLAKQKYPNAKIWVGFCATDFTATEVNLSQKACGVYSRYATYNGAIFMNGLPTCLYNIEYMRMPSHPNNIGTDVLAAAISSALQGGTYRNTVKETLAITVSDPLVQTSNLVGDLYFKVDDSIIELTTRSSNSRFTAIFNSTTGIDYTANSETSLTIAKYNNVPIGNNSGIVLGTTTGFAEWVSLGWRPCTILWLWYQGYLQMRLLEISSTGYTTGKLKQVLTTWTKFTVDLLKNSDDK